MAAAMPSGGHAKPDQHSDDAGQLEQPDHRATAIGEIPRWSRIASDCRTPSSLIGRRTRTGRQQIVTITVAMVITRVDPTTGGGRNDPLRPAVDGQDGASHVEIGRLDMQSGRNADLVSAAMAAAHVTVEETAGGGALAWHTAPVRQLVVTLAGDAAVHHPRRRGVHAAARRRAACRGHRRASGHQWQLQGTDPWRRMYVVLAPAPRCRSSATSR